MTVFTKLCAAAGKNPESVLVGIQRGKPSSFSIPLTLAASYQTRHIEYESYNVVGMIPGSDPILKNEYVVHTAHLDHVGIGRVENGDSIYTGAHNNASGIASLLEIGRIYKWSGMQPSDLSLL